MSQILDAIDKAEKLRQDALANRTLDDEGKYHLLSQAKSRQSRLKALKLPILIFIALGVGATGAYYVSGANNKRTAQVGVGGLASNNQVDVSVSQAPTSQTPTKQAPDNSEQSAIPTAIPAANQHKDNATKGLAGAAEPLAAESLVAESGVNQNILADEAATQPAAQAPAPTPNEISSEISSQISKESDDRSQLASLEMATDETRPNREALGEALVELTPISDASNSRDTNGVDKKGVVTELIALTALTSSAQSQAKNKTTSTKKLDNTSKSTTNPRVNEVASKNNYRPNAANANQSVAVTSASAKNNPQATPAWKKSIQISALVYDDNQAKRFVLISGAKVFEGGQIPSTQTRVVRILPTGIIINDGGGDVLISTH